MLNKVILIGNVGSDPDIRTMPSGKKVANFSLATSEYWTDKNGQRQNSTEWHKICIYNENLVKLVEKAVHKGSKIYVEGMIKSRKYTSQQDGVERTIVEIILQGFDHTIKLLDPRPRENNTQGEYQSNNSNEDNNYNQQMEVDNQEQHVDDDIPF